jgi:hypothetical protein
MGKSAQRRHERMMMQRTDEQLAEQRALREESEAATKEAKEEYREFEFVNPFEDLTVDTTTFDLQREMGDQARANILSQFRGVAGGSGIASLAQSLANQGTLQARQITADIARQERQNEMMYRQGEQMVSSAEAGRVSTFYGAELGSLAGARAGFAQAQANEMAALGSIAQMHSARVGVWGDIAGGVAQAAGTVAAAKVTTGSCIAKGICIDTVNGSVPIEDINVGDMVIGYNGNPTMVIQKHNYKEDPKSTFYDIKIRYDGKVRTVNVGGWHRIMDVPAPDIKENIIEKNEYKGVEFSYDLLTEDAGYRMNGVPVNSMIEEMAELVVKLKNK